MEDARFDWITADLKTLDTLVDALSEHAQVDLPAEVKKQMLTDDICGIYNAQAWYVHNKKDCLDNPPEDENPLTVRELMHKNIDPLERDILNKFKDVREKICKYTLDEECNKRINNYILNHPVLSEYLNLSKDLT